MSSKANRDPIVEYDAAEQEIRDIAKAIGATDYTLLGANAAERKRLDQAALGRAGRRLQRAIKAV